MRSRESRLLSNPFGAPTPDHPPSIQVIFGLYVAVQMGMTLRRLPDSAAHPSHPLSSSHPADTLGKSSALGSAKVNAAPK